MKTSDEYFLSRNIISLRSTVQVYYFFLGSVNFQCMFSFVYCLLPEAATGVEVFVRIGVLKNSINLTGMTPVLKNICHWLLLCCTRTTRCYLSVLLYIQHLQKLPPEVFCKKKVFLEISQKACNFIKKRHSHRCFPVTFAKFLRTCFLQNQLRTLPDNCFCTFFLAITATTINFFSVCLSFKFKRLQRILNLVFHFY